MDFKSEAEIKVECSERIEDDQAINFHVEKLPNFEDIQERNYFGLIHVKGEIVIKEEPFNFQEEHTPNNKICPLDQNQIQSHHLQCLDVEMVYVPPKSPEANGTTIQTSSANSHKTELIESIANREVGQNRLPQSSRSSSSSSYSLRDSNAENPTHSEHNESPESLSGHEETNQQSTKSRKRKKNHLEWRRNLCKKLRNSGKEYKTLAKGTLVKKREILAPCNEKCRLKCTRKFTDENRSQIFTTFWNLEDLQKQRCFVLNSMRPIMPKYKKVRPEGGRERSCNKAYYFTINSVLTQVCQRFFTSTLGISDRCIRTVVSKDKDGFLEDELRGKNKKSNVPEEVKQGIREHLSSIPAIESHYTRANTEKKYIDDSKTLTQLYRDYQAWCTEVGRPSGKLSLYRHIFNYEFNMSFHSPKKDQCLTCTTYQNSDQNEKEKLKTEYDSHIREKELSRAEKKEDKENISETFIVACFDLQAALPLPKGDVSSFYYKSRLNCYNFTICKLQEQGLGNVECFFWHEGEGKRGAIEIGTCLLKFLEKMAAVADSDDLEIVLYSDNCGGQGKNQFVVTAYLYAVTHYRIKSITHKFFVVGHRQNEGDSSHSIIEKSIKRTLKGGAIYVPAHYSAIILGSRKTGSPFTVNEMAHTDFVDVKDLTIKMANTSFNENSDGEKFNFNNITMIRVEKGHADRYFYKTSYEEANFKTVVIQKEIKTRGRSAPTEKYELKPAYTEPLPISKNKYDDLKSLILNRSIPSIHASFFEQLRHE